MSEQALDAHLERISNQPEEMVEVEKGYLEYLESENTTLKRENNKLREMNGLLRTRLLYYGRVLTKEGNREDVILAQEQDDE